MRLIDYDAAIKKYKDEFKEQDICSAGEDYKFLKECFTSAPTIDPVHAAGGCYCKECEFYKVQDDEDFSYCSDTAFAKNKNDFCSDGVKKERKHEGN